MLMPPRLVGEEELRPFVVLENFFSLHTTFVFLLYSLCSIKTTGIMVLIWATYTFWELSVLCVVTATIRN